MAQPTVLCPTCGFNKTGGLVNLQAGAPGSGATVVFTGCSDCLMKIVVEHKVIIAAAKCYCCGEMKTQIMFDDGTRQECPLHANAKRLLAQALTALGDDHAVSVEIREMLGVRG